MVIAAAFLFFCSTGLFFGGALRRHPGIIAFAGLISVALAILVYQQSLGTTGPAQGARDFLVPYLYFVSSAAVLGQRFWQRPIVFAGAGLVALAFAILAYPQMYATVDWIHRKSSGAIFGLMQLAFHHAEAGLRWATTVASANAARTISEQAVLHSLVSTTMLLLFAASGLASRLFVLSKRGWPVAAT